MRNLNSLSTVTILNVVRYVGALAFLLLAVGVGIAFLVNAAQDQPSGGLAALLFVLGGGCIVTAALFFAVVGWFADTLTLLRKIATA